MRRFGIAVLWAIAGYFLAAIAAGFLLLRFSANVHDRSVEAAMTSVFFFGPAGAIVAFAAGLIRGGRRRRTSKADVDRGLPRDSGGPEREGA